MAAVSLGFAGCSREPQKETKPQAAVPTVPQPKPGPYFSLQFAGMNQLVGLTNLPQFAHIATNDANVEVWHTLTAKLLAARSIQHNVAVFDTFARDGFVIHCEKPGDFALAMRTNDPAVNPAPGEVAEMVQGLLGVKAQGLISTTTNGWVFLTSSNSSATKLWMSQLAATGHPAGPSSSNLFQLEAGKEFLSATGLNLERATVAVWERGETVRTKAVFRTLQPHNLPQGNFKVPTNLIGNPLLSFTATHGVFRIVGADSYLRVIEPFVENETAYLWAQGHVPFQSFVAFPVKDPTNALAKVVALIEKETVSIVTNMFHPAYGKLLKTNDDKTVWWSGLPVVSPTISITNDLGRDFIVGGLFPPVPKPRPIPAEMVAQVESKTNLVHYHWEITQTRLFTTLQMSQLIPVVCNISDPATNVTARVWASTIAPELGNCITEVTATGPSELTLSRSSYIGLGSTELTLLTLWLDNQIPIKPSTGTPKPGKAPVPMSPPGFK